MVLTLHAAKEKKNSKEYEMYHKQQVSKCTIYQFFKLYLPKNGYRSSRQFISSDRSADSRFGASQFNRKISVLLFSNIVPLIFTFI